MTEQEQQECLATLDFMARDRPSAKELKKRWKDLCTKHHPDKGGNEEEFYRITHAYKMLTDPEYREKVERDQLRRKNPNGRGDLNLRIVLPVTFDEAFFGRKINISYSTLEFGEDYQLKTVENGQEVEVKTITIDLPPGAPLTGDFQVTKTGMGHRMGDKRGDAVILVNAIPHPKFQVRGHDVYVQEEFPLEVLLRGGEFEVQTMYGLKTLWVPPGTAPGTELKVKKCGVGGFGSHIVSVLAKFPGKEDLKEKTWKGLKINWKEDEERPKEEENLEETFRRMLHQRGVNIFFEG